MRQKQTWVEVEGDRHQPAGADGGGGSSGGAGDLQQC